LPYQHAGSGPSPGAGGGRTLVLSLWNLLWLLLLLWSLLPVWQQRALAVARVRLLRRLEQRRGTRVIAMIHRQESISFLGIPIARYITIEDSEEVLRAIRLTPPDMPIDLILHTPGGLVLATEQIAHALASHPARVTVFVPHYAMSGGTLLALAADDLVMDPNAVLGPVDPQIGHYPAASILAAYHDKPKEHLSDETVILADIAGKAVAQMRHMVRTLLARRMDERKADELAEILTSGRWTHDFPLGVEELRALGIPSREDMPQEIYDLMDLYPQPGQRRPSVQYVPLPYGPPHRGGRG
jgi:ClpP class serine protease